MSCRSSPRFARSGGWNPATPCQATKRTRPRASPGSGVVPAHSVFEENAVSGLDAQVHRLALVQQVRRRAAHDDLPFLPVDVILREVALEDAAPDPRGPHVD